RVVAERRLAFGEIEPRMLADVVPDVAWRELLRLGREVALDVTVPQAREEGQHQPGDENPGEGEMPAARRGEVVGRGDRRPAGEWPRRQSEPRAIEVRAVDAPV